MSFFDLTVLVVPFLFANCNTKYTSVTLREAFTTSWPHEALIQDTTELTRQKASVKWTRTFLVFDIDCVELKHTHPAERDESIWLKFVNKIEALKVLGAFVHFTDAGARAFWKLEQPIQVNHANGLTKKQWADWMELCATWIKDKTGIEIDLGAKDVSRLMSLPLCIRVKENKLGQKWNCVQRPIENLYEPVVWHGPMFDMPQLAKKSKNDALIKKVQDLCFDNHFCNEGKSNDKFYPTAMQLAGLIVNQKVQSQKEELFDILAMSTRQSQSEIEHVKAKFLAEIDRLSEKPKEEKFCWTQTIVNEGFLNLKFFDDIVFNSEEQKYWSKSIDKEFVFENKHAIIAEELQMFYKARTTPNPSMITLAWKYFANSLIKEQRSYSPTKEWLITLRDKWISLGSPNVISIFIEKLNINSTQSCPQAKEAIKRQLVIATARAAGNFVIGSSCIIFLGRPCRGKTATLRALGYGHGFKDSRNCYVETDKSLEDGKTFGEEIQNAKLIVNFDEMTSFRKTESDKLKEISLKNMYQA